MPRAEGVSTDPVVPSVPGELTKRSPIPALDSFAELQAPGPRGDRANRSSLRYVQVPARSPFHREQLNAYPPPIVGSSSSNDPISSWIRRTAGPE